MSSSPESPSSPTPGQDDDTGAGPHNLSVEAGREVKFNVSGNLVVKLDSSNSSQTAPGPPPADEVAPDAPMVVDEAAGREVKFDGTTLMVRVDAAPAAQLAAAAGDEAMVVDQPKQQQQVGEATSAAGRDEPQPVFKVEFRDVRALM